MKERTQKEVEQLKLTKEDIENARKDSTVDYMKRLGCSTEQIIALTDAIVHCANEFAEENDYELNPLVLEKLEEYPFETDKIRRIAIFVLGGYMMRKNIEEKLPVPLEVLMTAKFAGAFPM